MLSASKHNQATPTRSRSDTASGSDKRAGGGARLRLSLPRVPDYRGRKVKSPPLLRCFDTGLHFFAKVRQGRRRKSSELGAVIPAPQKHSRLIMRIGLKRVLFTVRKLAPL